MYLEKCQTRHKRRKPNPKPTDSDVSLNDDNEQQSKGFSMTRSLEFRADYQVHSVTGHPKYLNILAFQGNHQKVGVYKEQNGTLDLTSVLTGLGELGWATQWSPLEDNIIISCDKSGNICEWDIEHLQGKDSENVSFHTSKAGTNIQDSNIKDLSWSQHYKCMYSSISNNKFNARIHIWDRRQEGEALKQTNAHDNEGSSVAFNPKKPHLIASATKGEAKNVAYKQINNQMKYCKIWDLRNFTQPLVSPKSKVQGINQIEWHPIHHNILGAACDGGIVKLWDFDATAEIEPDPCFTHRDHTEDVLSFSFAPTEDVTCCSGDSAGVVSIWQPFLEKYQHQLNGPS